MKNLPDKIYLNFGYDYQDDDVFVESNEVIWSVYKIDDNDVEYVRRKVWTVEGDLPMKIDEVIEGLTFKRHAEIKNRQTAHAYDLGVSDGSNNIIDKVNEVLPNLRSLKRQELRKVWTVEEIADIFNLMRSFYAAGWFISKSMTTKNGIQTLCNYLNERSTGC